MNEIQENSRKYRDLRDTYEKLARKISILIEDILKSHEINYHIISFRAKDISSFEKKIENPKYTDPFEQITDLAGIRIIAYVEEDVYKICDLISKYFIVDLPNSSDKSQELGIDRVGYKSVHFVCTLGGDRVELPEYKLYENYKFEIQVRTILQHSWAEIEHDKDYKFSGVLPDELKRRFRLIAGALELLDREFNQLSKEIDVYVGNVKYKTRKGDLDISVDSSSLLQYLNNKLIKLIEEELIEPSFVSRGDEKFVIDELKHFGINTIRELDKIIPGDIDVVYRKAGVRGHSFLGFLRLVMMKNDYKKYFKDSFKGGWSLLGDRTASILREYNLDTSEIESLLPERVEK